MLEMYARYIVMLSECITTGRLSSVERNVQKQCLTELIKRITNTGHEKLNYLQSFCSAFSGNTQGN